MSESSAPSAPDNDNDKTTHHHGPRMVSVVAPANLREGYTFEASLNGELFDVIVPKGGVVKDQIFSAPFSKKPLDDATSSPAPEVVVAEPLAQATSEISSPTAPKIYYNDNQSFEFVVSETEVQNVPPEPPTRMVSVIAPSNMKEGQTFKASFNGQTFDVTVPAGGVSQGQVFSVPLATETIMRSHQASSFQQPESAVMVSVIAPANLSSGDVFKASFNGEMFDVKVPTGGVIQGQVLSVPFVKAGSNSTTTNQGNLGSFSDPSNLPLPASHKVTGLAPHGEWRNELCGCFDYGCCNPIMCWAWWFSPVALAQVMTRMKLDAGGNFSLEGYKQTFAIVVGVMVVIWLLFIILVAIPLRLGVFIYVAFLIYFLMIGTKTRMHMRKQYDIDGSGLEDCCCFYWCTCCTISQMAHHTHAPKIYKPQCCTTDGLSPDAPEIV